ncbi:(2Fe-2S) ferredoxin domain-containing protein [Geotoga petraea]|jgi:NADP-reducing hydrogenase subunit HndB|uniref:(2Fe-2S) ferredoxin domain-containing protein n=1 Tax=Geotoga petraea TaxID=28234 RepID=A0A1G6N4Q8_9BACT|nr:(2Fe-2S) ferredoxin domain-containing protein [Geotoga petraea]MDK2945530.1 NADP-reducing hydrogenase subunit HndB [Geotoga sp.]TGG87235.1 (2Fe-2S) ferredoxin domain-containing protein [Geotoga petraea]SDC62803.1 NAD(P)-dependent iron-only hydrogenase iron-sulfur protein [Geotoga petraea]
MAKIKSIEELMKMKDKAQQNIKFRNAASKQEKIILKVAMGTCGISSGAKETFNKLIDVIDEKNLENVVVIQTGCMGYCHAEPTVEINEPGKDPILYGHIDESRVEELVEKHLIKKELLQDSIIGETHQRAE